MKHCDNCNKDFDTEENVCPVCGTELFETDIYFVFGKGEEE